MPIRSLGYLRWETPQAEDWRTFATDVLGLMPVAGPEAGALYFRWDERPYRLVVVPSERKQVTIGFEVRDDLELEETAARLEEAGVKAAMGGEEEAADRLVSGFLRFEDPSGAPVEVFHAPILDHLPVQTPLVSGFVTGEMGMGHVVVGSGDVPAAVDFYRGTLGFRLRNTMRIDMGGPAKTPMYFLGCNPRHHTLGLIGIPFPGHLVHFMVEAASLDDVGRALDRCTDAGVPLAMSLGRHTNDHMVSFYCVTPDGAMVEFGWGGLHVDEATETTYEITKVSFWGHRPPKRG
ncbi:MAG TPA: VOC family protein [Acidimicrobiales bacterium]|nr:VOC family protein [Acidimicrobiales bacterium]